MKKPAKTQGQIRRGKNPSALEGIPVKETNLTPEERRLLPDPDILTEDDADAITAYRRRNEPAISFDQLLKKHGYVRR